MKTGKKAAARKVASQFVQKFTDGKGRIEFLVLSSPDNRLRLTTNSGPGANLETREVTLSESFAWYQKAQEPTWWDDGECGPAWDAWLRMVAARLCPAVTAKAEPAELMAVREDGTDGLWIDEANTLTLVVNGTRRNVSIRDALLWWLGSIEEQSGEICSDPRGEFAFFRLLADSILIPMNDGEMAAAKLCALDNNGGDLSEWAKSWVSSGMEADLPDVCYRRRSEIQAHKSKAKLQP